jgi:bifunctional non-homologous end joining protein LigD
VSPDPILPQRATPEEVVVTSVAWLFEPYWPGDRLIARLDGGRVTLTDAAGAPAGADCAVVAEELRRAIDADAAVIDGVWTTQPFPREDSGARVFVALDLVELEGQSLADVPYLERRRLLASVLEERAQVRLTPSVRHPARRWLDAWRANGFTRYVAKHVNSRYRAGEQVDDWLVVTAGPERSPSIASGLLGRRRREPRRIED